MRKKEAVENNKAFAYWSGFGGVELHYIEYGIEDYIYFTAGAWNGAKTYHKAKVYYTEDGGYFKLNGYKIPLNECLRIN